METGLKLSLHDAGDPADVTLYQLQLDVSLMYATQGQIFNLQSHSSCTSWLSKKQPTMATFSCEAEYRAVFTATSALAIARNPIFHARTKHIEVHYHYVRERLSIGEISLAYVPTQDNFADLFTKIVS
ncbi:hypothetical protein L7F22_005861 [Adiantum nelumboides]|nr:hypothetical protein [Adiantum nelumboides]